MGDIPSDLLLYIIIAFGLVMWLRNTIGTRTGDERQRPNPFEQNQKQAGKEATLPASDKSGVSLPLGPSFAKMDFIDSNAYDALEKISAAQRDFDAKVFVENAKDAFVIIVEAFAEGDKDMLRELLSESAYKDFEAAIDERNKKGETVETEIIAVKDAQIIGGHVENKQAFIEMRIRAEEVVVIRDAKEAIISGDPDHITEMDDIWVFGRHLKSKDPVWRLYETRDGEPEDHKTPIPETA